MIFTCKYMSVQKLRFSTFKIKLYDNLMCNSVKMVNSWHNEIPVKIVELFYFVKPNRKTFLMLRLYHLWLSVLCMLLFN